MWRHFGAVALVALVAFGLSLASVAFNTEGRLQRVPPVPLVRPAVVPVYQGLSLVQPLGQRLEPVVMTGPLSQLTEGNLENLEEPVWLGKAGSGVLAELQQKLGAEGFWMLDLSPLPAAPTPSALGAPSCAFWTKLRDRKAPPPACCDLLAPDQATLLALAQGMAQWHRSVRFCAKCGGPTTSHRSGANRRCTQCGSRFRPRIDPAMIVLVTHRSRCLLGRKASWPAGRFSALSGFVDFGESLEECVAREVHEESGVRVDLASVTFVASQPWLFPRSLLLGCTAEALDDQIRVDNEELEDVRWFEAGYIKDALAAKDAADGFNIPSKTSLAHNLIKGWLKDIETRS